jgi:hypothetical protein
MRALVQFAIATANLACQIAFLFLATPGHGPIFIASISASTLLQCRAGGVGRHGLLTATAAAVPEMSRWIY